MKDKILVHEDDVIDILIGTSHDNLRSYTVCGYTLEKAIKTYQKTVDRKSESINEGDVVSISDPDRDELHLKDETGVVEYLDGEVIRVGLYKKSLTHRGNIILRKDQVVKVEESINIPSAKYFVSAIVLSTGTTYISGKGIDSIEEIVLKSEPTIYIISFRSGNKLRVMNPAAVEYSPVH